MEYNPYAASYTSLRQKVSADEKDRNQWSNKLGWYDQFDCSSASSALQNASREVASHEVELRGISVELQEHRSKINALQEETRLGWDPRYWFSTERSDKRRLLSTWEKGFASWVRKQTELQNRLLTRMQQIGKLKSELECYRCFDRLEAEATVNALNIHLSHQKNELEKIRLMKEKVDLQLRDPLAELTIIERNKQEVEREIALAKTFENELTDCSNSYERRLIHDKCSEAFGNSSPKKVISDKQRMLQSVSRNIGKLQDRLGSIAQRASRIVKTLVIDGNNLCYQHQTFIGLVALRALTPKLSCNYAIVIVFDANIRQLLHCGDREIAARFGDSAKVHVVASKQKADETLLDAANDTYTYVISNDRFGDFRDKPAVQEKRIIRHEILNGKVFVHDLCVAEDIATAD